MPVPSGKSSKMRGRKRRTHYKVDVPNVNLCPNCGAPVPSHRVCPNCGYYNGKPVIVVKSKTGK